MPALARMPLQGRRELRVGPSPATPPTPRPPRLGPGAHLHSLQPRGPFHARWTVGWTLEGKSRRALWSLASPRPTGPCFPILPAPIPPSHHTWLHLSAAAPPHLPLTLPPEGTYLLARPSQDDPPLPRISPAPGPPPTPAASHQEVRAAFQTLNGSWAALRKDVWRRSLKQTVPTPGWRQGLLSFPGHTLPCGRSEDTYRFPRGPWGPCWSLWSRIPLEARRTQIIPLSSPA